MTAPGGRGNMATKKKTTGASQPEVKGLSDTKRWIYGFALLFFALFVGVAVVSYFIYWRDDQNVALWSRVLAAGEQPVMNWGGKLGAVLAQLHRGRLVRVVRVLRSGRAGDPVASDHALPAGHAAQVGTADADPDDSRAR